jgi:hypothetical protein
MSEWTEFKMCVIGRVADRIEKFIFLENRKFLDFYSDYKLLKEPIQ